MDFDPSKSLGNIEKCFSPYVTLRPRDLEIFHVLCAFVKWQLTYLAVFTDGLDMHGENFLLKIINVFNFLAIKT